MPYIFINFSVYKIIMLGFSMINNYYIQMESCFGQSDMDYKHKQWNIKTKV